MSRSGSRFAAALLMGLIVAALTSALFFMAVPVPAPGQLAGFLSLLFAEILTAILCAALAFQQNHLKGILFRAGAYFSLLCYLLAAGIVAVLYMFQVGSVLKWLVCLEIVCVGLLAVVLALLAGFSKSNARENDALAGGSTQLRQLEERTALPARKAEASERLQRGG